MPNPTVAWFDSLTASAQALGAAAREYRTAAQTARIASWNTDPARLLPLNGAASVTGRDFVRPHHDAVWTLGKLFGGLRAETEKLYENAAQAYAYGTVTAVVSALRGEHPTHIELRRRDGRYVLPAGPLPDLGEPLADWSRGERLAALRQQVIEREHARAAVAEFEFFEDLGDCGAAELTEARERASGLGDSSYAYGEAAESALHFVLLAQREPRTPDCR